MGESVGQCVLVTILLGRLFIIDLRQYRQGSEKRLCSDWVLGGYTQCHEQECSLLPGLADGELEVLELWLPEQGTYSDPLGCRKKLFRLLLILYFYHLFTKFLLYRFYNVHNIQ